MFLGFSVIIGYIFYDTDFFIHIFMAFNGDYGTPNAGSGFGMILSYSLPNPAYCANRKQYLFCRTCRDNAGNS